jgi:hypothetical protein
MEDPNLERLIAAWLEGRISESESEDLQQILRESKDARDRFLSMCSLDSGLRQLAGGDVDFPSQPVSHVAAERPSSWFGWSNLLKFATAAVLILMVGMQAYEFGQQNATVSTVASTQETNEKTISGHATLRRVVGIEWSGTQAAFRDGDVLPAGKISFQKGVAEIDFFCGATVIVEGPAELELESDWALRLVEGRLRANVPPAARGFSVKVADSEVIDLGTEFALDVSDSSAWVQVVDGEIKLKGGVHDGEHLKTGEGHSLTGEKDGKVSFRTLSTFKDVERRHDEEQLELFEKWKSSVEKLQQDKRLVAYYPIGLHKGGRSIANKAPTGSELDANLVGLVDLGVGRFGAGTTGLGFSRPGSRARLRIDGEYEKFTFVCWARIDSLEHKYNALFMGDGYENGEPHWQLQNDGKMMFSVMVDDTPGSGRGKLPDSRLHRIYFTKPIWDVSQSGQWMHLAATYDPETRMVCQYVNGEEVSRESIEDEFFVDKLCIGPAEIGNWGQPLRKSPWFAIRNLNGAIDELAIFNAALDAQEIEALYDSGKPFRNQ